MLKNLFKLLFPELCFGCKSLLLQNETIICSTCRHQLPLTNFHLLQHNNTTKKFYGIVKIDFGVSMLYFYDNGIVQNLIHRLKYKGNQEIGTLLGKMYANDLKTLLNTSDIYEIIPVPLHKKRFQERGYNQVTTFCEALSDELKIPINTNLLFRNQYTKTQTKKDKISRQEVKKALFDIKQPENSFGKHFLLVDDVITTGATLEVCAKALLKVPNSKVSIITIAYTDL